MKKVSYIIIGFSIFSTLNVAAQNWKEIRKEAKATAKTNAFGLNSKKNLSEDEVGKGLKEALNQGVKKGVDQLHKKDGYLKDAQIKILMPEEAKGVESKLRSAGQGEKVDEAIESMNRAAEDAAIGAKPIFVAAIKNMTLTDVMNILNGENDAATNYLNKATYGKLSEKFKPVIKTSLDKVGATKYWQSVFETYNKIPFVTKVNPELDDYVTRKALDGLFIQVAKEELNIRKNPSAMASELLKKVFAQ